jgi:hypothetical protein
MDLNHRSPASKAGRDDQAPLHADDWSATQNKTANQYVIVVTL